MQRTIVGIRNRGGMYTVPKFSECLLQFFTKDNSATVDYSIEDGIFLLNQSEEGHELRHSPECPIKLTSNLELEGKQMNENEIRTADIGVATSVVIESSDSHILLTKRSAHMRSSPNVWVIPGGHIELGETVFEAGAREIKEETGLHISSKETSVLGLWENIYPLLLGMGTPKYHTLVIYLHTQLSESHIELTKKIIPNPSEVSSYCWLNSSTLSTMFNTNKKNLRCDGKQYIYENGELIEKYIDYYSMSNRWLRLQPEPYSGVNYALRKWIKNVNSKKPLSKL